MSPFCNPEQAPRQYLAGMLRTENDGKGDCTEPNRVSDYSCLLQNRAYLSQHIDDESNVIVIVVDLVVLIIRYDVRENEINGALHVLVIHRPKPLQDVYGACFTVDFARCVAFLWEKTRGRHNWC